MFSNDLLTSAELPMAAVPITAGAFTKQKITVGPFDIPAPGYVYIYVNDNSPNWVHFDDLKITHVHSPFVSGAVYYPFGLTMSDREILTEPYRFGYQGQYAEEEAETGWNSFDLRMYDARFGRWLSPDPYGQFESPYLGIGNMPNTAVDINGGYTYIVGSNQDEILKSLTKAYNSKKGKRLLDKYLNNPNQHLYFGYGKTRDVSSDTNPDGSVTEKHAGGITNAQFFESGVKLGNPNNVYYNSQSGEVDFSISANSPGLQYFQNFNGTEIIDNPNNDIGFITLKSGTRGINLSAIVIHETAAHIFYKDNGTHPTFNASTSTKIKNRYGMSYPEGSIQDNFNSSLDKSGKDLFLRMASVGTKDVMQVLFSGFKLRTRVPIRTPRFRH